MKRWIAIGVLLFLCFSLAFLLVATIGERDLARAELSSAQAEADLLKVELDSAQAEADLLELDLSSAQAGLNSTQEELADLQISCAELQIRYDGLITGHGYTIIDPSYRQMMDFIARDKTDENQYIEDRYVCEDFAMDVCNNAEEEGIRCAFVVINHPEWGHSIVAFNTVDKGLVYIESQTDEVVVPEIGEFYYRCVMPKSGYYYEKPDYDDTIEKILVIW